MFIGHFGIGFAAKRLVPQISLGTLFLAAQFVDLLWPILLLLGFEHVRIAPGNTVVTPLDFYHYPFSHSLLMTVIWGVLIATLYYFIRKRNCRAALWLGLAVVSHWFLDLLVHRADLPLTPCSGSLMLGLGLWNSHLATILIELPIFLAGIAIYLKRSRAIDPRGKWGLVGLIVFLLLIWIGNLYGSPPPSAEMVAWVGNAQWLLVIWGYWVDRHRQLQ